MYRWKTTDVSHCQKPTSPPIDDLIIMAKIHEIVSRGNNAEVKARKDGSLTVLEVAKRIV